MGGLYGGAFLLLRPLLKEFGDRIINSPIAENAIFGIAVGAAIAGQRPIAEVQFNDFANEQDKILASYDWVDQKNGVVRIPIDKAMDLLAQRGLPDSVP